MRIPTPIRLLSSAAAIALLAGCSSGGFSAIGQKTVSPQGSVHSLTGRVPNVLETLGQLKINSRSDHPFASYYACPARGPLKYVSDVNKNAVYIYTGKFAGQAPCGQIASGVFNAPTGIYVQPSTHDVYVANTLGNNILVFHRGHTTPYNTYADPKAQYVLDVAVAKDGTVVASNQIDVALSEPGSISTWIGGPHGGTFVANYAMTNSYLGLFITIQKSGKIFFGDLDATTALGYVWSVKCPAGVCGTQTRVAHVSLQRPGGMGSDASDDLLVNDTKGATANTFELPNPSPSTFSLAGSPVGMALNTQDNALFIADNSTNDVAAEYSYPSGTLIGTVPAGIPGGQLVGIAVDPGHAPN